MGEPASTILLIGKSGQLGSELFRSLPRVGTVVPVGPSSDSSQRCLDLADRDSVERCVKAIRPDIVVNAAAYTSVDKAEKEVELARKVNALAPETLAVTLRSLGAMLIHYSTDYVFNGQATRPYGPDDEPDPINHYGWSKLEGEQAIRASGVEHLILRTSMVYGARGRNFATLMRELLASKEVLPVVHDQVSSPTWTRALAEYTASLLMNAKARGREWLSARCGTYHLSGGGQCSRYEFARSIARRLGVPDDVLRPIPTSEYPTTPAKRPLFSVLDSSLTHRTFGLSMDSWEVHLEAVMNQMLGDER